MSLLKLYIVIYVTGQIAGTVGPLPYGVEECEKRTQAHMAKVDPTIVTPDGYSAKDVRLSCEWHILRPENEFK